VATGRRASDQLLRGDERQVSLDYFLKIASDALKVKV
jgi:hypothetical protein